MSKIRYRKQFVFPHPNPFFTVFALTFRAVTVSAGVVADADISAFVASIDMTAQSLCSALF